MKILLTLIIVQMVWIKCDLPIHCLSSQIQGIWEFQVSAGSTLISPLMNTCGHQIPDNDKLSYTSLEWDMFKEERVIRLNLKKDGTVEIMNRKNREIDELESINKHMIKNNNWTMVYDQGFMVDLFNGFNFFVYNKYDQNAVSDCSKTLMGWFQQKNKQLSSQYQYGCIKGKKIESIRFRFKQQKVMKDQIKIAEQIRKQQLMNRNRNQIKQKVKNRLKSRQKLKLNAQFRAHQKVVSRINKAQSSWKAKSTFVKDQTIYQLNKQMGRMKYRNTLQDQMDPNYPDQHTIQEQKKKYNELLSKEEKERILEGLPHNFDYEDMLDDAMSQGTCGSCYAIATANMLAIRLKLKYLKKQQKSEQVDKQAIQFINNIQLSVQQILDCNYYNQGCSGGYPSLVFRFAHENFLIPNYCKPYLQQDSKCSTVQETCNNIDGNNNQYVVKVGKYGYIGGKYGLQKVTAREIMLEIYNHGPLVVSFEPNFDLMYYGEGVYHPLREADWLKQGEQKPEFQKIDHSVLCYGWGTTSDGQLYWLLQNSWGIVRSIAQDLLGETMATSKSDWVLMK